MYKPVTNSVILGKPGVQIAITPNSLNTPIKVTK